jgi:hypothetical protein
MSDKPDTSQAPTDVQEFIAELDGGQFERMVSVALSQVAAAVVDRERKGEVTIAFKFQHIKGTSQVTVEHTTKFKKPTMSGAAAEDTKGATVLHVGRFGRLSLAQPSLLSNGKQSSLLDRK